MSDFIRRVIAKNIDTAGYDIKIDDLSDIVKLMKQDLYEGICLLYKYAFWRGQNKEKNRRKQRKRNC